MPRSSSCLSPQRESGRLDTRAVHIAGGGGAAGATAKYTPLRRLLSPFSTRRLFSSEATFSCVGVAYHISKFDANKGKSRFARKKSPSGKRALMISLNSETTGR